MDEADKDMSVNDLIKLNYEQAAEIERLRAALRKIATQQVLEQVDVIECAQEALGVCEQSTQEQIGCMSTRDDYPR